MNVAMPVYLFDVVTAVNTPRLVVTCLSFDVAQGIVARLNEQRTAGLIVDDPFVVAAPRSSSAMITVPPGTSVPLGGYALDVCAVATAVAASGR